MGKTTTRILTILLLAAGIFAGGTYSAGAEEDDAFREGERKLAPAGKAKTSPAVAELLGGLKANLREKEYETAYRRAITLLRDYPDFVSAIRAGRYIGVPESIASAFSDHLSPLSPDKIAGAVAAFDALVDAEINRLIALEDLAALETLASTFSLTPKGGLANLSLGHWHRLKGRLVRASSSYRKVREAAQIQDSVYDTYAEAALGEALCLALLGERERFERACVKFQRDGALSSRVVSFKGEKVELSAALSQITVRPTPAERKPQGWRLMGNSLDSVRQADTGCEIRKIEWTFSLDSVDPFKSKRRRSAPVYGEAENDRWLSSGRLPEVEQTLAPCLPVTDGLTAYVADDNVVAALDLLTGKLKWKYAPSRVPDCAYAPDSHTVNAPLILRDMLVTCLERWADIKDKSVWDYSMYNAFVQPYIPKRKLVVFDRYSGKLLWTAAAEDEKREFLAAGTIPVTPIAVPDGKGGDILYGIYLSEEGSVFSQYLTAMDAASGELLWRLLLATGQAETNIFEKNIREIYPARLVYRDGFIYSFSNFGVVTCIDAVTHTIKWQSRYKPDDVPRSTSSTTYLKLYWRNQTWANSSPVYFDPDPAKGGDELIIASTLDSSFIHAFNAETGEPAYSINYADFRRLDYTYFLGVFSPGNKGKALIVVSGYEIAAYDADDGRLVWNSGGPLNGEPAGMGYVSNDLVYIPFIEKIYAFELSGGRLVKEIDWPHISSRGTDSIAIPGNLVASSGVVLSAGIAGENSGSARTTHVTAFLTSDLSDKTIEDRIASAGNDAEKLFAVAVLYAARGQEDKSLEFLFKALREARKNEALYEKELALDISAAICRSFIGAAATLDAAKKPIEADAEYEKAHEYAARPRDLADVLIVGAERFRTRNPKKTVELLRELTVQPLADLTLDPKEYPTEHMGTWAAHQAGNLLEEIDDPAGAVDCYQMLLLNFPEQDYSLDFPKQGYSYVPARDIGRSVISRIITTFGRDEVYAKWDKTAEEELSAASASENPKRIVEVVDRYPNSIAVTNAALSIARMQRSGGNTREAHRILKGFLANAPDSGAEANILALMGLLAEETGYTTAARRAYRLLVDKYIGVELTIEEARGNAAEFARGRLTELSPGEEAVGAGFSLPLVLKGTIETTMYSRPCIPTGPPPPGLGNIVFVAEYKQETGLVLRAVSREPAAVADGGENGESDTNPLAANTVWKISIDSTLRSEGLPLFFSESSLLAVSARYITSIDAATGKLNWQSPDPGQIIRYTLGPNVIAVVKRTVLPYGTTVEVFDLDTGEKFLEKKYAEYLKENPLLSDTYMLLPVETPSSRRADIYDLFSGEKTGQILFSSPYELRSCKFISPYRAAFVGGNMNLVVYDLDPPSKAWTSEAKVTNWEFFVSRDTVIFGTQGNLLVALDVENGETLWEEAYRSTFSGWIGALVDRDYVYVAGIDRTETIITVLSVADGSEERVINLGQMLSPRIVNAASMADYLIIYITYKEQTKGERPRYKTLARAFFIGKSDFEIEQVINRDLGTGRIGSALQIADSGVCFIESGKVYFFEPEDQ